MTTVILVAAGVLGGALAGVGGTLRYHPRRVDAHEWRKVRTESAEVDVMRGVAERVTLLEGQLERTRAEACEHIAHLLDENDDLHRELDHLTRPRHLRLSAVPDYGPHRGAA